VIPPAEIPVSAFNHSLSMNPMERSFRIQSESRTDLKSAVDVRAAVLAAAKAFGLRVDENRRDPLGPTSGSAESPASAWPSRVEVSRPGVPKRGSGQNPRSPVYPSEF
jgi:hypothetical protein